MTEEDSSKDSSEHSNPGNFWFDEQAATDAVSFFETFLTHTKGEKAGQPLILEDWERDVVRKTFGWKRSDGTRRYRYLYLFVPRKNGKSTLASGIALYLLYADKEPGAEVYSAAADRDQANIVFDMAKRMVQNDSDLVSMSDIFIRSIVLTESGSAYRVLSADAPTKHGLNAHGIIFDELHAQKNRELWDVLTTSTGARRQPLIVAMTTAGYDRSSICWEVHDYAVKVQKGIIQDDHFLPVLFAADQADDWTDPVVWAKANPNLGVSIKLDYLTQECKRAKELPGFENTFKRLHLNLWTEQDSRWIAIETWDEGAGDPFTTEDLKGEHCFAGLDLASTSDTAALVLAFPQKDSTFRVLPFFFVPEEGAAKRSRKDSVPYLEWIRDGYMIATEGNVIDYDFIREHIRGLAEQFDIKEIVIDRWNAAQLTTQLTADGFTVVPFGQGFASLSGPTKELETLMLSKRLHHNGHPVLRWMASNVAVEQDAAGNIKPSKRKSKEKIDGIVALVMALGRACAVTEHRSVYEDRGILVL